MNPQDESNMNTHEHTHTRVENRKTRTEQEKRSETAPQELQSSPVGVFRSKIEDKHSEHTRVRVGAHTHTHAHKNTHLCMPVHTITHTYTRTRARERTHSTAYCRNCGQLRPLAKSFTAECCQMPHNVLPVLPNAQDFCQLLDAICGAAFCILAFRQYH
jgi:hypothetical protein